MKTKLNAPGSADPVPEKRLTAQVGRPLLRLAGQGTRGVFGALVLLGFGLSCPSPGLGQAVTVTVRLDAPTIPVGGSTVLRVFAQVVPPLRFSSERIFSWYVDVLNTNGSIASANYSALVKPVSDNDSLISGPGTTEGANRRGIFDTFLNLPGAGTSNAVELVRIPVVGQAPGTTRFRVQAGTGVQGLNSDFLVFPINGTEPFVGGDYTTASATVLVSGTICAPNLQLARGTGGSLVLTFTPCPGRTHTAEFRNALGDVAGWQPLPGAPHNSGNVTVANVTSQRFFRVRVTGP